jgi:2-dehydro-3-deoxygalactonokinase
VSLVFGDWGTSRLRLFRMESGAPVHRIDGPGIAEAGPRAAEVLRAALGELGGPKPTAVLLCGMAGARGALIEAPYAPCPARVPEWAAAAASLQLDGTSVTVAAGLSCRNWNAGADVMRGEETQLFGAMRLRPDLAAGEHLVVHPGTHAKWIRLADAAVERFHTVPTGELFALLSNHSTLLRAGTEEGDAGDGFAQGVERATAGGLLPGLFEVRAAQLIDQQSAAHAKAYLSGLLIRAEVDAMERLLGRVGTVTLIGDPALTAEYARVLSGRAAIELMDGEDCALAGLAALAEARC